MERGEGKIAENRWVGDEERYQRSQLEQTLSKKAQACLLQEGSLWVLSISQLWRCMQGFGGPWESQRGSQGWQRKGPGENLMTFTLPFPDQL